MKSATKDARYTDCQRLEAAQWFVDIHDSEDPPPELLQSWLRWLDASEGNRLAFKDIEVAWHETPLHSRESGPAAELEYDPSISVAEWQRRCQRVAQRPARRRRRLYFAAAATLVPVLFLGSWRLVQNSGWLAGTSRGEFATGTGEHMQLVLADGSHVTLGARSRLVVAFTKATRAIRLESGEAFFSVHKDPQRPFTVRALGGVVTAVGTAFDVRASGDEVTVGVVEGTVKVADAAGGAQTVAGTAEPVKVTRGEQLRFRTERATATLKEVALTRIDPAQPARWRDGWLVYRAEPLRYVIADVARYTDLKIALKDPLQGDLRFTGAVFKDSVIEWVGALPEVFPVTVTNDAHGVTISAKSTGSPEAGGAPAPTD